MMKSTIVATICVSMLTATPVMAERSARPGPVDHRVRSVVYAERDVVKLNGHYGFTTNIEFGENETIETVSIGDSSAWQVVKPGQPNLLFVKPIEHKGDTNMTVVTDRRIYNFMLFARSTQSHRSRALTFHIKFVYPNDEKGAVVYQNSQAGPYANVTGSKIPPENWNFAYGYSGSRTLRPERAFDDGRFTYFAFSDLGATPAIFAVDENGKESLVNYTKRGRYLVVERLARQFTLRDGKIATCIYNRNFRTPQFDGGAPVRLSDSGQPVSQTGVPAMPRKRVR